MPKYMSHPEFYENSFKLFKKLRPSLELGINHKLEMTQFSL
jgi:hypothetical protein